ncbi:hypothetical protein LIER_42224 [Lithospermum erythrorhizon]|uniref:Uncharacterized protein n=1 Tax=Lithospermum erythrorhizon TaxID=34254 RepID=A0AAV3RL89_LITER
MTSFFTLRGDSRVSLPISTWDNKDITIFPVHASLYKGMSIEWDSVPHSEDEVAAGRAAWDGPIKVLGTFGYTPGYWEWAEDVLSRCSSALSMAHLEKAIQVSLYVYDSASRTLYF